MTEFNLSEKETTMPLRGYPSEDIKEFIKETLEDLDNFKLGRDMIIHRFKKRAGDDLI